MAKVLSESFGNNTFFNKAYLNKQTKQRTFAKHISSFKEIPKAKDEEINLPKNFKQEVNYQKTAMTTQSDYDPNESLEGKFLRLPLINQGKDQYSSIKDKYEQSCVIIAQLELKLRTVIASSKNTQQQLKSEIQILRQDLRYLRQQRERSNDTLRIQMEHRHNERMKLVQHKYKQQIDLMNQQIASIKRDNCQKTAQITRLTEKIKKQRVSNENNCKFLQNKNAQLGAKVQYLSIQSKQQVRRREEALIAHFKEDLESLHKEQAGQIKMLCDRIRMLKGQLQQKDMQIKELGRAQKVPHKESAGQKQINLSMIEKYLKQ